MKSAEQMPGRNPSPQHLDCFTPRRSKTGRSKTPNGCSPSERGQVMVWRSLVGFVWNCKVLPWDGELQPSAGLEAGEQSGWPLPPRE